MPVKQSESRICVVAAVLVTLACAPQSASPIAGGDALTQGPWIDVAATLDPATTPVYEGDAPMSFEFLKDMRKGDGFTLSKLSPARAIMQKVAR